MTPVVPIIVHASTVAVSGRAVLILGASGTGKSALALALLAYGGVLVADDSTILNVRDGALIASAPKPVRGMIEARGVGLLAAATCASAPVVLAVDMGKVETARLPPTRDILLAGQTVTLLRRVDHAHFPAAIMQYLKAGRCA